jgi:hypothetical protein
MHELFNGLASLALPCTNGLRLHDHQMFGVLDICLVRHVNHEKVAPHGEGALSSFQCSARADIAHMELQHVWLIGIDAHQGKNECISGS